MPGRFDRFADRVLGPSASEADRDALKQKLSDDRHVPDRLGETYDKTIDGKTTLNEKTKRKSSSRTPRKDMAGSTRSTGSAIRFSTPT